MTKSQTTSQKSHGHRKELARQTPLTYDVATEENIKDGVKLMRNKIVATSKEDDKKYILVIVDSDQFLSRLKGKIDFSIWNPMNWLEPRRNLESPLRVTTANKLQSTIKQIEKRFSLSEILMLVHESVREISFIVSHTDVDTLKIFQCRSSSSQHVDSLIDGASTFGGTRIDEWRVNGKRKFYVGETGISIRMNTIRMNSPWVQVAARSWEHLPSEKFDELKAALNKTIDTSSESKFWKKWKGPAATILGIVAGTTKFAAGMKTAAGGIFINYTGTTLFGTHALQVGAAYAKFSTVITAAGPAMMIGAGAAAALYFIPWKSFFSWAGLILDRIFRACKRLWGWFVSWWTGFKSWVEEKFKLETMFRRTDFAT